MIKPQEEPCTFRVMGVRSNRRQKRALEFEQSLSPGAGRGRESGWHHNERDTEKVQWYLEDNDGRLIATAQMVSFKPFTPVDLMPYPLRQLMRKHNFVQLRGEQLHFISHLTIAPEHPAERIVRELTIQIYDYCILCTPGTLILNLARLDLVTRLVIDEWQVFGKCATDIFGDSHTVLLGKQTGIEFLYETRD